MKLILKTVSGKQVETSVEESTTIGEVKKTLEDEYDPATLRLCFKGAVLDDDKTIKDLGLTETDSLIIAGKKRSIPKPSPPPAAPAPAELAKAPEAPNAESAPAPASAVPAPAPSPAPAPAPVAAPAAVPAAAPAAAPTAVPAAVLAPDPVDGVSADLIDGLVAMGFEDRAQVALALRAAFMNPDRAVEYLCTGIPPHIAQQLAAAAAPAAAPAGAARPAAGAPPPPSGVAQVQRPPATTDLRTALWNIPQFEEIRTVFQANSESMPVVMEQINERYPQIYQLIEANPAEFLAVMQETGGQPAGAEAADADGALGEALNLTAADRAAVLQLVELGGGQWDEQAALLVYIACQRDQETAGAILFEHGGVPAELLQQLAAQMGGEMGDDEDFSDEDGNEED